MDREQQINEAIALIEDALEKGEIEERTESNKTWRPPGDNKLMLGETANHFQYRAKKQSREWWIDFNTDRFFAAPPPDRQHCIKVREVTDD